METTRGTILEYLAETQMETCHSTRWNSTVTRQTHTDLRNKLRFRITTEDTQILAEQKEACSVAVAMQLRYT